MKRTSIAMVAMVAVTMVLLVALVALVAIMALPTPAPDDGEQLAGLVTDQMPALAVVNLTEPMAVVPGVEIRYTAESIKVDHAASLVGGDCARGSIRSRDLLTRKATRVEICEMKTTSEVRDPMQC